VILSLFSNKDAKEIIIIQPYESYVETFNEKYDALKLIVPTVSSVSDLYSEEEKLEFIKAFRELLRVKNILGGFSDFKWDDLKILEQEFEDYMSKYLDLKPSVNPNKEKVSILEDVDFELELIHKDEINVTYILKLLGLFKESENEEQKAKQKEEISNLLNNNPQLRSKREIIEKFINENLVKIDNSDSIEDEFIKFWDEEKVKAFNAIADEENLNKDELKKVVDTYIYEQREPLPNDIAKTLIETPKYLDRKTIVTRVLDKIVGFVDKFYESHI
jgi:type I restriction enzyme R subunit